MNKKVYTSKQNINIVLKEQKDESIVYLSHDVLGIWEMTDTYINIEFDKVDYSLMYV